MNKEPQNEQEKCQNCNHSIKQNEHFCSNCGQKVLPERLTLKYFIHEFLSNYFSFDSKFFNTIRPLLFKPAFLSSEFISGRRIRYINPIQLFIFISFLYFLIDSFMFLKRDTKMDNYVTFKEDKQPVHPDSLDFEMFNAIKIQGDTSGINMKSDSLSFTMKFIKAAIEFQNLDPAVKNEKVNKFVSYFVFILTPFFAFLLFILFRKSKKNYLENLIFSLHFHAFFFFVAIIFALFDRIIPEGYGSISLNIIVLIYLLVALRRFYEYKWFGIIIRSLSLIFVYGVFVIIFFVLSVAISIIML